MGRKYYADTLRKLTSELRYAFWRFVSLYLFLSCHTRLTEGQKFAIKRQSTIHFPKLPSKKVKQAEGQKQVACWIDVKARWPGVTL